MDDFKRVDNDNLSASGLQVRHNAQDLASS